MSSGTIRDKPEKPVELLAPAGNPEAGYAALHYGAAAVYLGLENFSARAFAGNFSLDELADLTGYAHSLEKRRKVYVAINTLILQSELGNVIDMIAATAAIGVDAIIVQDLGVLYILRKYFPQIKIHASTQMAIHNRQGVETAVEMGIGRVTLARELSLSEIAEIAALEKIETEVFIHGALCYSYSGLCLFSSHLYGRSGNRGQCAYPCREWFRAAGDQKSPAALASGFIFSMKDLALPGCVAELRRSGVTALKIEGRMKSPLYVAAAVNYYRRLIDGDLNPEDEKKSAGDLKTIFSRPWTELYLRNRKNRDVIDREIAGHRGSPAGKVEKISKSPFGHYLRFRTALPLELHDGLQFDIAGQPRPFGFAVKNIYLVDAGDQRNKKRVFTVPEGSTVEIPLPCDHPHIPLDTTIYSSSSQKVKRAYDYFSPKPGQFRVRHPADFEIRIEEDGFEVCAASEAKGNLQNKPLRSEIKKRFDGHFEKTRDSGKISAAIENAFGRLGNTNLKSGRLTIHNSKEYFIPISLLNSARREITAALEQKISEVPRQYADEIKIALHAVLPGGSCAKPVYSGGKDKPGSFKWSIKTDQPQALADFQSSDWKDVDEVILECFPENLSTVAERLEFLSGQIGKSRLRVSLPVIRRTWETNNIVKLTSDLITKGWHKWQISNLGGLSFLQSAGKGTAQLDISADWPLYTMNHAAVLQLRMSGIKRFTLSPEDGLENMRVILKEHASDATVIVYQDTPLMISENCIFAGNGCPHSSRCHFRNTEFAMPHGEKIRLVNHDCRLFVCNTKPYCLAPHFHELASAGAASLRADFMYRQYSPAEAAGIWRALRSNRNSPPGYDANFIRGMKQTSATNPQISSKKTCC